MADKINRAYIQNKLDSILHPMATKIFMENPTDHIEFMLQFLSENHGKRPGVNTNERMELEFLRKEVASLKSSLQILSHGNSTADDDAANSDALGSELSDDSEEDVVYDLAAIKAKAQQRGPRASVSAEAFGIWNKKEEFKAPFYNKSDAVKSQLK